MSSSPEPKSNEESSGDGRHQAQDDLSTITERLNDVQKFSEEWFQLKEQEVALRNEIAMADGEGSPDTELKPPADTEHVNNHDGPNYSLNEAPLGANNTGKLFQGGPEIIRENSGPIHPTSFDQSAGDEKKQSGAKNITVPTHARGGLEIIQQDNGPVAPMSLQQIDNGTKILDKARTNHHEGPEIIQDVDGPDPPASLEQTIAAKINHNNEDRSGIVDNCDESISYPSRNDIEDGVLQRSQVRYNRDDDVAAPRSMHRYHREVRIEEAANLAEMEGQTNETNDFLPSITEAYLVDDGSVVIATPKVPWWKQRRTKILLGFVLILIVTVLAVSLKITLAPERTVTQFVTTTVSPTNSLVPSLLPSSAPSFSQMPSLAPSKCSKKVISNMKQIELLSSDVTGLNTAIDGDNLVIAWVKLSFVNFGSLYIAFYSRSPGSNDWISSGYMVEPNIGWVDSVDVSLSENKALVGVASMNTVYAFVLSNTGLWVEVPFPPTFQGLNENFGYGCEGLKETLYICEDLAAVAVSCAPCYMEDPLGLPVLFFFKDNGGQWVEIGMNSNSTISELLADHAMQDKYPTCLSTNPSSYSATRNEDGVHIYLMDKNTTDSTHIQTLSSSIYGEGFGNWSYGMAMYEDLLVVESAEHTHIFAQEDGSEEWEEVLRLDQSYDDYELSGRTLIAVDGNEVYSMIIADCTPEIIIQDAPQENSANCSEMNVVISFEGELQSLWGSFLEWGLLITSSEFLEEDSTLIQNYTGSEDLIQNYTICLNEGWYRILFVTETFWTSSEPNRFNVRFDFPKSKDDGFEINGFLDSGGWSGTIDEVHFDIPRTTVRVQTSRSQYPTYAPTVSSHPSASISPTQYPTTTHGPTRTNSPTYMYTFPTWVPTRTTPTMYLDISDASGWKQVSGEGIRFLPPNVNKDIADEEFRALIKGECKNADGTVRDCIIRRFCDSCTYESHRDIYYKRLTPIPDVGDADGQVYFLDLFLNNWFNSPANELHTDFELYSSYEDALAGTNAWKFCNYNDPGIGFPRDCSDTSEAKWHQWNSYIMHGGDAGNHGFYVELPHASNITNSPTSVAPISSAPV